MKTVLKAKTMNSRVESSKGVQARPNQSWWHLDCSRDDVKTLRLEAFLIEFKRVHKNLAMGRINEHVDANIEEFLTRFQIISNYLDIQLEFQQISQPTNITWQVSRRLCKSSLNLGRF